MAYRFDQYDNSIVMDGFENGIAESPHAGISDMRNINIVSIPGEASVNFTTVTNTLPTFTGSVTSASAGADTVTFTLSTGTATNSQAVVFSGGSLPPGITAGTTYWVKSLSGSTFKLSTKPDGSDTVDITNTGTGTFVSTDMGTPNFGLNSVNNGQFMIDVNGRAWKLIAGVWVFLGNTTLTNASGNGIAVYRGYLFVFRNALIDYMVLTSFAWTYGWQTMNATAGSGATHQALIGQDDVVYYCDATYVGSFTQKVNQTFDPSNSATYTWTQQALALPSNENANCLAELGTNLLVGGQLNAIYPWNRTATSFTYPILISDMSIARMVTVNTNTYIFAGVRGRIFITNGSQAQLFKKVPDHISGTIEPTYAWGDANSYRNQLYFGISAATNNGSVFTGTNQYGGVWAVDLDTDALRLTQQLSYGTYNGRATVIIVNATNTGSGLLVGWNDTVNGQGSLTGTAGMDGPSTPSVPYSGSQAYVDFDLIPIGTYDKPRDFTRIEYKLTKPLVSGESVTLNYRTDFSQSYTQVLTDNTAGNISLSGSINFKNAQWIQIQAVLNSTSSSPSYTRLKQVRLLGLTGQTLGSAQQFSL